MSQRNLSSPSWSDLMTFIQSKSASDIHEKVVPAFDQGRKAVGGLIIALGSKIQSSRHS